ncbi:MAG: AMP-binding protein [Alphaproteobacteria bacterium]
MLIGDLLRRSAARFEDKVAFVDADRRLSFGEADRRADQVAHGLLALGLGKGHTAAILSANRAEYPVIYFGAARAGGVLAHLSLRYTDDDLVYVLDKVDAEAIFVEAPFAARVAKIRGRLPKLRHTILLGAGGDGDVVTLDDFTAGQPEAPPNVAIDENDPYVITFTGGTTGFPKAVLASHKARCFTATIAVAEFGLDERDVVAVVTPLFHAVGLLVWMQAAVSLGATSVFMGWDKAVFTATVEREAISASFLVPTQLNDLIADPGFDAKRLAGLRKINFAGAPMAPTLFQRVRAHLPEVIFTEHYAQSEACPITVRPPSRNDDKAGSVGRACFGVDLAVVDGEGNPVAAGEMGEVVTRGDHLLSEYRGDPGETAAILRDGWLWTGDVGVLDEDGYLSLIDRSKDMFISGGENIYPTEIENTLYLHDAVAECAVFGIPDERWGEVPAAHVVLAEGAAADEAALIDFCAARIARHKRPRVVKFVDALPRTAVGKIQKQLMRDPYWKGRERKI